MDVNKLWQLIGGPFGLKAEIFQQVTKIDNGLSQAIWIVLFVGLSLGIGQSIILFINRVKPSRFIFNLLISAVLYTFGFLFQVFSTGLICLLPASIHISWENLVKVLGLSYAPQLFSFLGALPYVFQSPFDKSNATGHDITSLLHS